MQKDETRLQLVQSVPAYSEHSPVSLIASDKGPLRNHDRLNADTCDVEDKEKGKKMRAQAARARYLAQEQERQQHEQEQLQKEDSSLDAGECPREPFACVHGLTAHTKHLKYASICRESQQPRHLVRSLNVIQHTLQQQGRVPERWSG
jgi:hypothetical protein